MTVYVFDSGPLIDLFRHYYRDRFPSLWEALLPQREKYLTNWNHTTMTWRLGVRRIDSRYL